MALDSSWASKCKNGAVPKHGEVELFGDKFGGKCYCLWKAFDQKATDNCSLKK